MQTSKCTTGHEMHRDNKLTPMSPSVVTVMSVVMDAKRKNTNGCKHTGKFTSKLAQTQAANEVCA